MGSWNETCTVSHKSLSENDKVIALIMKPNKKESVYGRITETPHMLPACLPLIGEYSEYGDLSKVTKSETVTQLEKTYGLKIKNLINFLSTKHFNLNRNMSFQEHSFPYLKSWVFSYEEDENISEAQLKSFGLKKEGNEFVIPKKGGKTTLLLEEGVVTLKTTTSVTSYRGVSEAVNSYSMFSTENQSVIDFVYKSCGYLLNVKANRQDQIKNLMDLEVCWVDFDVYQKMTNLDAYYSWKHQEEDINEILGTIKKKSSEMKKTVARMAVTNVLTRLLSRDFTLFYEESITDKEFLNKEVAPYYTFLSVCTSLGIKLIPQYPGEQFGNPKLLKAFHEVCLETYNFENEDV